MGLLECEKDISVRLGLGWVWTRRVKYGGRVESEGQAKGGQRYGSLSLQGLLKCSTAVRVMGL